MVAGIYLIFWKVAKSCGYDIVEEYMDCIGNHDDNLGAVRKSLRDVCSKKDDIKKKVKEGIDKQEEITTEVANWFKDTLILTEDEELKYLMYKDTETAKYVVKLMESKYLKKRMREECEMHELVVDVMKRLKEDIHICVEANMKKTLEDEYKEVAEIVVEVMKDGINEFKKLIKEDVNMARIAARSLKGGDLDKLTKGDKEIREIIKEARYASVEELCPNREDDESNALQPLLVKIPDMGVSDENMVKEATIKLLTPLPYLMTLLHKLMDDDEFKKSVPHAEDIKLALEVVDGLLIRGRGSIKEMKDLAKRHRGCCCFPFSLFCYYCDRYRISKAAKSMAEHIQDELISKCPENSITLPIRPEHLKPIPTSFLKGLDSRTRLLRQLLEKLNDDRVDSVGVCGMGGAGKTVLVKEVMKAVKNIFSKRALVEVSDVEDIVRIQSAIAESINLPLKDVNDVAQRALRLYNRLISEKKVLIILDNIWKELSLDEIGIPRACKLLLTTREKAVCRVMGVKDANIITVGLLDTDESRELFKSLTGNQVIVAKYRNVVSRLLSKCGGLPLTIVATASSLKDKDLHSWEKFADELEKPISSQVTSEYRHTYSVLETSYKFIKVKEKRIFFLLASLSPLGSSISIESLIRYGIGLNLFENVNKLSEAIEKGVTWANELKLSSMLIEGDVKGDVKMHDLVRAFAISYAAKEEEHTFMVEGIPRWMDDVTLKKYTAMSLTSKNEYSRLSGIETFKLQILVLEGDFSPNFDDFFFDGMGNLEVLALSNMNFQPCLPQSMGELKKLKTLSMERCKLGTIELVGKLVNLLVLSLRESFVETLPIELENLRKLRLLDLRECTSSKLPLIPTNLLNALSTLEGLYLYNNRQSVFEMKSDYEGANSTENNWLPYLNALEIKVAEELPIDGQLIKSLDKFRISVGNCNLSKQILQGFSCILSLDTIGNVRAFLKKSWFKLLLKKADLLDMRFNYTFENLAPQLDQEGFSSLIYLGLFSCDDVKCIVNGRTMNNRIAFPSLQTLKLEHLRRLKTVCCGDVPRGTFSNLQTIRLHYLYELRYGLSLIPHNVKEISVLSCKLLEFMFIEEENNEDLTAIELPFLKSLHFSEVPCLLSLVRPKKFTDTSDAQQPSQIFFDGKIVLPALEVLELRQCNVFVQLWSKDISTLGFQNLKDIKISSCGKLSSVGSPLVFAILLQLETLSITDCNEMEEVVSVEETEERKTSEQIIKFPQLKYLKLSNLSNLVSFYRGEFQLEFPKLKSLLLDFLGNIERFATSKNISALFHEKIDFPCLKELQVIRVNHEEMGLWDEQSLSETSNPAPMLKQVALCSSAGLRQIPTMILENITSLKLAHFQGGNVVFPSSNLRVYSQLPKLEELQVQDSTSLKELFQKEDCSANNNALSSFCAKIKTLALNSLRSLNPIPLELFKSIVSLTLSGLKWKYLISAHFHEDSLCQLQFLSIEYCHNMEALVENVDSQINFPNLKQLRLRCLSSFIGISSTPEKTAVLRVPSLETLLMENNFEKLEHFWKGSIEAPSLQEVSLSDCDKLSHFLVGNIKDTIDLPSLQKVSFYSCQGMKSISSGSVRAPNLREVKLQGCHQMECFFPGNPNHNDYLQLHSLEIVEIESCSKLRSFSLSRLLAPKLTLIKYNEKECSILSHDNLNHFLEKNSLQL